MNVLIKTVNMKLVKYIGYHTATEQTMAIMGSIFVAQFFNTGILILLTNANT